MRSILPLAVALVAFSCAASNPIEGFHPEPDDFARLHLEATDTNLTHGPRDRRLQTRLVRSFGPTLEVSVGGRTVRIRVAEPRTLDFPGIDRDCQYAGFRLDTLALEANVSVTEGAVVFTATGQSVPLEAGSDTADLPAARRWVRILGAGPAWPLAARLIEREPAAGGGNYTSSGSVRVSGSASGSASATDG